MYCILTDALLWLLRSLVPDRTGDCRGDVLHTDRPGDDGGGGGYSILCTDRPGDGGGGGPRGEDKVARLSGDN